MLVHSFDDMDHRADPWKPCPPSMWCHRYSDRFSACLMNQRVPHLFNGWVGGFIIAPGAMSPVRNSIACQWSYDAGTMGQGHNGCEGNGRCKSLGSRYWSVRLAPTSKSEPRSPRTAALPCAWPCAYTSSLTGRR